MAKKTLAQIRKELKMSQETLAHELGITLSSWNMKENYKRKLTANELVDLAEIAKMDPRQIILKP